MVLSAKYLETPQASLSQALHPLTEGEFSAIAGGSRSIGGTFYGVSRLTEGEFSAIAGGSRSIGGTFYETNRFYRDFHVNGV